ncbi:hypothetical protein FPV67DRAFT_1405031 [Lyophyllum atratum]|nr:hypothetical protein FPV67DRAFT_1405031 [Lyophyllum atratum]
MSLNISPGPIPVRRYHAVARKLKTLPPELVHQVLDDLPVSNILEIICGHDIPYVDTCVLSHMHLRRIFPTPESLSTVKQYFTLYMELCQRRESAHASRKPFIPALGQDALVFVSKRNATSSPFDRILASVKADIQRLLETYEPYLTTLSKFAPKPLGRGVPEISDLTALWDFWINLEAAERSLNSVKSSQLRRIAKLHVDYPGTLRMRLDTSQASRHHSEQHRINELEFSARRVLKLQILLGKFIGRTLFSGQRFPVVPYDRHLRCFLKEYAPVLRTKYTPYSHSDYRTSRRGNQPHFLGGSKDDGGEKKHLRVLLDNDSILPLEEKEFEWLEAFLRACRYMEGMDDAEWRAGMTVKQYWKIHVGDVASTAQATTVQEDPPVPIPSSVQ